VESASSPLATRHLESSFTFKGIKFNATWNAGEEPSRKDHKSLAGAVWIVRMSCRPNAENRETPQHWNPAKAM
jgi:hypothetical protein